MPARLPTRPVGLHVPVAGGLATGLRYAAAAGAEAVQVFVSSPRGWGLPKGDPAEDAVLAGHIAQTGLPLFVHAPYLVNLGSPDLVLGERSAGSLAHSLRRGGEIGARAVVVHAGSAMDGDRARGLRRMRERVLPLLDSLGDDSPDLLVEPMAGQGHMLCSALGDLGPYLEALGWHPRVGICLDTCHALAAGHDLTAPGGVAAALSALPQTAGEDAGTGGRGRLRLIHANDSKDPCGSRRDRHEHIGSGHIGTGPFRALLSHPATRAVPFIVETPGPREARAADVAILRRLRGKGRWPGAA